MRSVMGMLGVAMLLALAAVQLSAAEPVTSSSDFVVEYPIPVPDSGPLNIVVESPGRVWFTMSEANMIGSLVVTSTTEYRFTTFAVPTANSVPYDLVFSDGLVWFTENAGNKIGRLDPASGSITEYSIPTANSGPAGIDVAPDGMMWFVERDGNRLGSLDPDTGIITDTYQYSRPDSRLEDVGGHRTRPSLTSGHLEANCSVWPWPMTGIPGLPRRAPTGSAVTLRQR
jgi:streptogramin lyase